jgi:hypothetical protein
VSETCPDCGRPFATGLRSFRWGGACGMQLSRTENNDTTELELSCATVALERTKGLVSDMATLLAESERKLAEAEAKVASLEAEPADVAYLDLAARYLGSDLGIPSNMPGLDEDHAHFVLSPIGPVSRRVAVAWLKANLRDEDQAELEKLRGDR